MSESCRFSRACVQRGETRQAATGWEWGALQGVGRHVGSLEGWRVAGRGCLWSGDPRQKIAGSRAGVRSSAWHRRPAGRAGGACEKGWEGGGEGPTPPPPPPPPPPLLQESVVKMGIASRAEIEDWFTAETLGESG